MLCHWQYQCQSTDPTLPKIPPSHNTVFLPRTIFSHFFLFSPQHSADRVRSCHPSSTPIIHTHTHIHPHPWHPRHPWRFVVSDPLSKNGSSSTRRLSLGPLDPCNVPGALLSWLDARPVPNWLDPGRRTRAARPPGSQLARWPATRPSWRRLLVVPTVSCVWWWVPQSKSPVVALFPDGLLQGFIVE